VDGYALLLIAGAKFGTSACVEWPCRTRGIGSNGVGQIAFHCWSSITFNGAFRNNLMSLLSRLHLLTYSRVFSNPGSRAKAQPCRQHFSSATPPLCWLGIFALAIPIWCIYVQSNWTENLHMQCLYLVAGCPALPHLVFSSPPAHFFSM
jgi:hypothetical protein